MYGFVFGEWAYMHKCVCTVCVYVLVQHFGISSMSMCFIHEGCSDTIKEAKALFMLL